MDRPPTRVYQTFLAVFVHCVRRRQRMQFEVGPPVPDGTNNEDDIRCLSLL